MVGVKSKNGPKPFELLDVEETLKKLTIKEKVDILAGRDMVGYHRIRLLEFLPNIYSR